jgi:hydroxymethylpyrimidine/phosphomethylpyrimidine kinase
MSESDHIPNLLSIAGVDPSGGAGVLADLKTFSALGTYGCGVIAALTAQNTRAVTGIHEVPPEFLRLQLDTLFEDVRIDAVKIGMLASSALIRVVAEALRRYRPAFVVLDPVMVAKSGDRLLEASAIEALKRERLALEP